MVLGDFVKTSLLRFIIVGTIALAVLLIVNCDKKDNPVISENNPPVVTIVTPANNANYVEGDTVSLTAVVVDSEDGELDGDSLVWMSNVDGQIGIGVSCQTDSLSINTHRIILSATDSKGAVGYDTATVVISQNTSPVVIISSPTNGSAYIPGEAITFNGSAVDSGDGTLTDSSLVWTSDQDGQIGTGATFTTSILSENSHAVILAATDSRGAVGYDTVTVVVSRNIIPVVTISSPANSSTHIPGGAITFTGSAVDSEDGQLTGSSLVWTSNIDGQIGTGTSFTTMSLSANGHAITLTATDGEGDIGTAVVMVNIQSNSSPVVTISNPANDSTYIPGEAITFTGLAVDPEDGTLTGTSLVWTSNVDGQIGTGTSFTTGSLSTSGHVITLTATDSDGDVGTGMVAISVQTNSSPVVNISSPASNSIHIPGESITFAGSVADPEDGTLVGSLLVWTSNVDGQIGTGTSFTSSTLSENSHAITLTATDSRGNTGTDLVTVNIQSNSSPVVTIASPASSSTYVPGGAITFTGSASDTEDGTLAGSSLVWVSDQDGQIGTGTSFTISNLSENSHVVTLSATDTDGDVGTALVTVNIQADNPPVATITSPVNNSTLTFNDTVTFSGVAVDPEDGTLSGSSLVWTSDKDGMLGAGITFTFSSLSVNSHIITLTATDSDSRTGSYIIVVNVQANTSPVVTLATPADDSTCTFGDTITFTGSATDSEDGGLTGTSIVWTSDKDGQIGTGVGFTIDSLSLNTHVIVLSATDRHGAVGTDTVTVTLQANNLPVVAISGPTDGSSFAVGQAITLTGSATDSEDGSLSGTSLVWTSDKDGLIGTGTSDNTSSLSANTHVIILKATDRHGGVGADTVTITRQPNSLPVATITSPTDGSSFAVGQTVTLAGSAIDSEDGSLTGSSLVWTSDQDGLIGTGTSDTTSSLSANTHVIILTATDSNGGVGTDTVTITRQPNNLPVATITSPTDGSTFEYGQAITFEGSATDSEDGSLTGSSLVWTSDQDGPIGTGTLDTTSSVSVNTHVITLTATDSDSGVDTAMITITVNPNPGFTFGGADHDYGYSVGETAGGDYIIMGYTLSSAIDHSDNYVIKTDNNLNVDWEKNVGGTYEQYGKSGCVTADGGSIITGFTMMFGGIHNGSFGHSYLGKSDNNGVLEWGKFYGPENFHNRSYSVCLTSDGGYMITGVTSRAIYGDTLDVGLLKTDSNGDSLWAKTFGGVESDSGLSVIETIDGDYVIAGNTSSYGAGSNDVYLIKTDSIGDSLWTTTIGGAGDDYGHSVFETSGGDLIITGYTSSSGAGGKDVYLVKTNSSGSVVWEKTFGGVSDDCGNSVYETSDGYYIITGYTNSAGAGGSDLYLIKTDNNGNLVWEKTFGGENNDLGKAVIESSDGSYIISGSTESFGEGGSDIYVIRTDTDGIEQ